MNLILFFIGFFVGACFGVVLMAIAAAARRADDWKEWAAAQRKEHDE